MIVLNAWRQTQKSWQIIICEKKKGNETTTTTKNQNKKQKKTTDHNNVKKERKKRKKKSKSELTNQNKKFLIFNPLPIVLYVVSHLLPQPQESAITLNKYILITINT